jgi:hypothetical protein
MVSSHSGTAARKTSLPEDQLAQLNNAMNTLAGEMQWSLFLGSDKHVPFVLAQALAHASTALQSTELKDRVIAPKSVPNHVSLDEELGIKEKAEWGILLKKALQQGDWVELITHRMSRFLPLLFLDAKPHVPPGHSAILQVHSSMPAPSFRQQRLLNTEVYRE